MKDRIRPGLGAFRDLNWCLRLSRLWLIACLAFAAVWVVRSLWSPSPRPLQVASAASTVDVGWHPAALADKSLAEPTVQRSYRSIEALRVGDRVVADNPDVATPDRTAVDPATWRLVRLYAEERWADGTLDTIHVETLQPPEWIKSVGAEVGAQVPPPLDLVEMGLRADLRATVVAVEPCPRLQPGAGRLVLTTVNHLNNNVWELTAVDRQGRQEQLRPTGLHKFYSQSRHDWASTKDIHDNEVIRGRAGPLTIVDARPLAGTQRVYNLTVEGEHVYYASNLALLAHNTCGTNAPSGSLNILNPEFTPNGTRVLQNLTNQVNAELVANPRLATTVLTKAELDATGIPGVARMQYGNALERLVAEKIENDTLLRSLYQYNRGAGPDFTGIGPVQGQIFDITTPGQVPAHLTRPYGQGLNTIIYQRPAGFP